MNVQSKKKMVYMTIINPFQSAFGLLHQVEIIRYFSIGAQWLSGRVLDIYMTRVNPFQSAVGLLQQFFLNGGSVVECLTRDRGAGGSNLTCVVSLSKNINPILVLV